MSCEQNGDSRSLEKDPLRVVQPEKIPALLAALKDDCPRSASMYSAVRTNFGWHQKDPKVKAIVLAPQTSPDDGGACCMVLDREVCVRLMVYAREPDVPRLMTALKESARIPWRRVTQVARLPERILDPLRVILQAKGCHHVVDELHELVWLSAQEALALPDPIWGDGIRLREAVEDDALRFVANWPHAAKDAVHLTTDTIRFNGGLVAQDDHNNILGWVLWNHCGGLGQLFVYPQHRRKGVARLLSITMSKRIARDGHIVTANVATKNDPSVGLLRSLNFRHAMFNVYIEVVRHDEPPSQDRSPN